MRDRELMQMALDALEEYKNVVTSGTDPNNFGGVVDGGEPARKAIKALRERLAQPEPEPIAWMVYTEDGQDAYITSNPHDIKNTEKAFPLWAYPKEWVGVTDEEVKEIWQNIMVDCNYIRPTPNLTYDLVREVQNLLKERNT